MAQKGEFFFGKIADSCSNGAMVLLVSVMVACSPAVAQSYFSGPAQAKDGDSLSVSGLSFRLFGIDAPELNQICTRGSEPWKCGEEAKRQLQDLVSGKRVQCRGVSYDEFGRTVAICKAGNIELNKAMVEAGWATAFRRYSDAYSVAEDRAKAAKLGIWDSEFQMPEDYRQASKPPEPRQAPVGRAPQVTRQATSPMHSGCTIKGNHSRKGEWIYHLPGMPYYDATIAEEMFCTEAEARAAGYRRSRARW